MSQPSLQEGCESTNPLVINPTTSIERAKHINVDGYKQARRRQLAIMSEAELQALQLKRHTLNTEIKYSEIEENILKCRHMIQIDEDNPEEIAQAKTYLDAAVPAYQKYMDKMTELEYINAKIKYPPQIPITFTEEETSDLYWWLIKYENIDHIADHAAGELRRNRDRMLEKLKTVKEGTEEWSQIEHSVMVLGTAADQWRPAANAAIRERCGALDGFAVDDIIEADEAAKTNNAATGAKPGEGRVEVIDGTN